MDDLSQATLDRILTKEVHELTGTDKGFLRARISYLTKEQKEKYKTALNEKPVIEKAQALRGYRELQKRARDLGLQYRGVKAADLAVAISTIEGPGSVMPE